MRLFGEERKQLVESSLLTGSEWVLGRNVVGERHALPRSCTTFSGGRAFTGLPAIEKEARRRPPFRSLADARKATPAFSPEAAQLRGKDPCSST